MARVGKKVQEINTLLKGEELASFVVNKYNTWRNARQGWDKNVKELRNYIFQTDTTQTSNKTLPWKNSTSIPKICQIRDNLHANYMAALFPHDNWFKWEADNAEAAARETARIIEAYMRQKIRHSNFKETISKLVYDYIDAGNAFGEVTYESEVHELPDGTPVSTYNGPVCHRISPYDIYFDLTADNFKDASKITRRITSIGSLKRAHELDPLGFKWVPEAIADVLNVRNTLRGYGDSDLDKSEGDVIDGFGSRSNYYSSDMVELLEFEGDTFNLETAEVNSNRRIVVMDRRLVVSDEPIDSWLGRSNKEHVGWRTRPDTLLAMGPLDNLVGMQYRLDHLENLKADVFDQIAHPVMYQKGMVEEWDWGPGERIFGDIDSDIQPLRPDTSALQADFQMDRLMRNMEELVGAPREAMGIRSPGEKTAFEIQTMENAAGRIFQQKIQYFEEHLIEPLLNQMLESARRNLTAIETVQVLDEDLVVQEFLQITPTDLNQKGKLYPIGARHFAKQAQVVQNLLGIINSAAYQDPSVNVHISGLRVAQLVEEQLGFENYGLVQENVRIIEGQRTQSITNVAQQEVAGELADAEIADLG